MKLAHFVIVTPGRCGLYETTRDLVMGLRRLGVDSRMVNPQHTPTSLPTAITEDRGAPIANHTWAEGADYLVNHSGLPKAFDDAGPPIIHVSHGRPHSSFLMEVNKKVSVYSYHYTKNKDPRFTCVITFWPEHKPYMELNWPDKPVHVVPAPVDIDRWTPNGPTGYQFGGKKGAINLVCCDGIREDNDPFVPINAALYFARTNLGTKFHLYAAPKESRGWDVLYQKLRDVDALGEVKPWVSGLDHVYRAADCVLTSTTVATRVVREAMACGCPVAPYTNNMKLDFYARYIEEQRQVARTTIRRVACQKYDSIRTALAFKEIADGLR